MNRNWTGLFLMRGSPEHGAPRPLKRLGWGVAALALVGVPLVVGSSAVAAGGSDLSAGGLEARSVSDGVELSWDEPVDLPEQVTGYRILRRRPSLGEYRLGELVADTGSTLTTYLDTDVTSGTRYIYRVMALRDGVAAPWSRTKLTYQAPAVSPKASEEHSPSEQQEGSGLLRDDAGEPVTAEETEWTPQQLSATGLVAEASPGFVVLTWDAPEGDADAVDGYEILRRRTNRGERVLLTLVADTGTADTSYVDRSANEEGVKYAYRVKALRDATASVWSPFTNAVGQANSVEFAEVPEPEFETSEQHDGATEYSDRAVFGIDFDFDCNRSYPYQGFRLRDESLTGYDGTLYFEDNNPYIKKAADTNGRLLSDADHRNPNFDHYEFFLIPVPSGTFPKDLRTSRGNRYIVNWEGVIAPVTIEGMELHSVNPILTEFQGANDVAIRDLSIDTNGDIVRNGSATGYSIDGDGVFLVRINSCSHLRFRNPHNMSYFTGQYRVERMYQEQYEHIDESDWPDVPRVRYYVDDYGVRGGWQYHNIGIPSCGTKYYRVAALYSSYLDVYVTAEYMSEEYSHFSTRDYDLTADVPGTTLDSIGVPDADHHPIYNPNDRRNNNEPFRRGPWEYIEWRNPDCEDTVA